MKKIITVLLAIVLTSFMCVSAFASENVGNMYTIGDKTVVFEASSVFTAEEQQYIAEMLVNPDADSAATYGLMCTLFGHKETTEAVTTITHGAAATAPRCLQENFLVTICTRCEETISMERISFQYISCCPEE